MKKGLTSNQLLYTKRAEQLAQFPVIYQLGVYNIVDPFEIEQGTPFFICENFDSSLILAIFQSIIYKEFVSSIKWNGIECDIFDCIIEYYSYYLKFDYIQLNQIKDNPCNTDEIVYEKFEKVFRYLEHTPLEIAKKAKPPILNMKTGRIKYIKPKNNENQ